MPLPTPLLPPPPQITGTLREYQMMGLSWLVRCFDHGVNAILADEMVRTTPLARSLAPDCPWPTACAPAALVDSHAHF